VTITTKKGPEQMTVAAKKVMPALIPALILSACVGAPPRFETPNRATLAALNRINENACNNTVASALDAYKVPAGSIRDLSYSERLMSENGDSEVVGYTAWMHLTDQPGSLVVDVDDECRFGQIYTRDGAQFAGVFRSPF
jgi:hypothetical protein